MKDTAPPTQSVPSPTTEQQSSGPVTDDQELIGNAAVQEQMNASSADEPTWFDKLKSGQNMTTTMPFNSKFSVMESDVVLETVVSVGANPGTLKMDSFKLKVGETKEDIEDGEKVENDLIGFEVEITNGDELQLDKMGVSLMGLFDAGFEEGGDKGTTRLGNDKLGAGFTWDGSKEPSQYLLNLDFDVFQVLFGAGLEAAQKEAGEVGLDFDLGATFSSDLQITDDPGLRLEHMKGDFNASVGAKATDKETGVGEFGAHAGVAVSMETDYAEGTAEDPWSKTTGKASASFNVTLFGQTFGFDAAIEDSAQGTFWEQVAAQERMNEVALEAAYSQVVRDINDIGTADRGDAVDAIMGYLTTGYTEACTQIEKTTGVNPMKNYGLGPPTKLYSQFNGQGAWRIEDWHDLLRAVTGRSERAKMIHEWIIYQGHDSLSVGGDYTASGGWSGPMTVSEIIDGSVDFEFDGGTMMGTIKEQIITGKWFDNSGDEGDFTLQVQEKGDRMWGHWTGDGEIFEWALDRK